MTYLLRKAETEYWREKFCESRNSKEFWKTVKDCTNINIIKKSSVVRILKNNNNTEISDDIDRANFINSYFTSIGENLSQKHSIPDDFDVLNHIYRISRTTHSTEISITQIAKDLEKVKAKKAPGPDGISSKVLSLIKSSAADGLFTVFHKSSTLNKFPDIWKQAKIIPVYKKGSFSDVSNYRPISLLSISGKLLESQICSIIDSHLQACNLLSEHQWGFRKGLSSEDLLLVMTEKWKLAMDKGQIVGAIFIDFQKAFDTVSHEILSLKLNAVGISGPLHQWLMNYLFDRYQYTEINNKRSALLPIRFGVPQGSLLGPRLYTIYTNDLPNQVKDGLAMMYADDTTLYTIGSSIDQVISSLNVIMSQISKWSSLNKLTIHPSKTEAMILAKQQFIGPLQPLHFGPGFVKLVNSTSCLGVTIDNKLSWHSQVDVVKASFSKKIGALRRMSYLPKLTLEEIYFKTIIPSITYGNISVGKLFPIIT